MFVARYAADGTLLNVVKAGGAGEDIGIGVATDGSGNAVVTGSFTGTATFGSGADAVTLTSAGLNDVFWASYAADGTFLSAMRAGGRSSDYGTAVATDRSGNIIVTGILTGTATFGSGAHAVTLTSGGFGDMFVARYAPDGTLVNALRAGGPGDDNGRGVAIDGSGNAVVTGSFFGAVTFGSGTHEVTLTSIGGKDMFVVRYAADGTLISAASGGGNQYVYGYGVATDASGDAVVTGGFLGTATFGSGGPSAVTLMSAGANDAFVARYAPDGTLISAVRAGGAGDDISLGVATDGTGNAVVTGYFNGTATFGNGADAVAVASAGGYDVFVSRYAPDGTVLSVVSAGGPSDDFGYGVATDGSGNAVVTGYFTSTASFGSGAAAVTLTSAGAIDMFLARYAFPVKTAVVGGAAAPAAFRLIGAAPNPFNPTTTIRFDLPTAASVTATVYDLLGRPVRTLGGSFAAGPSQSLAFDAAGLPSGVYLVRLSTGTQTATVRVMLAK